MFDSALSPRREAEGMFSASQRGIRSSAATLSSPRSVQSHLAQLVLHLGRIAGDAGLDGGLRHATRHARRYAPVEHAGHDEVGPKLALRNRLSQLPITPRHRQAKPFIIHQPRIHANRHFGFAPIRVDWRSFAVPSSPFLFHAAHSSATIYRF